MDGSIKKRAAWGLLVLLLGAAPALACERDLPHRHEWPGGVSEPRPLAPVLFGTSSRSFWPTGNSGTGSPDGRAW